MNPDKDINQLVGETLSADENQSPFSDEPDLDNYFEAKSFASEGYSSELLEASKYENQNFVRIFFQDRQIDIPLNWGLFTESPSRFKFTQNEDPYKLFAIFKSLDQSLEILLMDTLSMKFELLKKSAVLDESA